MGIDNSTEQLATARSLQAEYQLSFPLIHGNAETVPLPDASFDLAIRVTICRWWSGYGEWRSPLAPVSTPRRWSTRAPTASLRDGCATLDTTTATSNAAGRGSRGGAGRTPGAGRFKIASHVYLLGNGQGRRQRTRRRRNCPSSSAALSGTTRHRPETRPRNHHITGKIKPTRRADDLPATRP
ncbi:MAG: class I SAM-dependent methyltransferase [Pseudonocardia sp.]